MLDVKCWKRLWSMLDDENFPKKLWMMLAESLNRFKLSSNILYDLFHVG